MYVIDMKKSVAKPLFVKPAGEALDQRTASPSTWNAMAINRPRKQGLWIE